MPSKDLTWNLFGRDVTAGAAFRKAADDVRDSTDRMSKDVDKWDEHTKKASGKGSGIGLLTTAIVALAPAAVPLAGVAAGLGAGFAAAGAVAVVGILGIKDEMKQGTQTGLAYKAGVATLNTEFVKLKQLAAAGMLTGFQSAIKSMQPLFPLLNRDVALFSSQLGTVAGHVAPALVSLFHGLNPLFITFGDLLVSGSAKLQAWAASSGSVGKFVAFVQTELPSVMHTLGALTETVAHLAMGFAPLGSATVMSLGLLAQAINAIPINVLTTLVPVISATVLAFKAMRIADTAAVSVQGFASKLWNMGGAADGAARLMGGASSALKAMGIAGLIAGPAIGLLVGWLGKQKQAQQEAQAEINNYTQALLASNLVVDESVRALAAKTLADKGAFAAAAQLGISQAEVTNAVTGTGAASAELAAKLAPLVENYQRMTASSPKGALTDQYKATLNTAHAANDLNNILSRQSSEFKNSMKSAADQKAAIDGVSAAQGKSASAARAASDAVNANAKAMGLTRAEYLAGEAAAKKNAASIQKQTDAMMFANDAAGLLTQSLNLMNGVNLDVAAAQTTASAAWLSLTKTIHANGDTVALNTDAGIANRQAIEAGVRANQQAAEAQAKTTKSGSEANRMLDRQRDSFLAATAKAYGLNSAVYKYTLALYGVPKRVTSTADLNAAAALRVAAVAKERVAELGRMRVTARIYGDARIDQAENLLNYVARDRVAIIRTRSTGDAHAATGGLMVGGRFAFGPGGYVAGPGSGTSDSVLARVSNGEYVVRAAAVARVGVPFMNALNRAGGGSVGNAPVGGGLTVHLTVNGAIDPSGTAQTIVGVLSRYYRNGGARP